MTPRLFLNSSGSHPSGLTIDDVLDMNGDEFEDRHDLIQWMFPTMRESRMQPQSPVLTWQDVEAIRNDVFALAGLTWCRNFYTSFLEDNQLIWLVNRDHNHLRITRVIESLSLLDSTQAAIDFKSIVTKINAFNGWPVNVESAQYWNKAVHYGDQMRAENG